MVYIEYMLFYVLICQYLSHITFRDNAVYRSNSFKFERRAPVAEPQQQPVRQSSISNIIDQVIQTKKPNRVSRTKKEVILR